MDNLETMELSAIENPLLQRIIFLESNSKEYSSKVDNLSTDYYLSKTRLDGYGKELKILLAEINIIAEWIYDRFDVQLIDKQSLLFKHIHDYDEIENISSQISMENYTKKLPESLSGTRTRCWRKRRISLETSEESVNDFDEELDICSLSNNFEDLKEIVNECNITDDAVDIPEEVDESGEISRPRRKSRRKIDYKEFRAESNTELNEHGKGGKKPIAKLPAHKGLKKRGRKPRPRSTDEESVAAPARVEVEAEKVPKRGRPKKAPSEKIENWKNRLPVQCDECGKIFKGSGSLRTHKMIHVGSRPFECTECGKAFRRKHHLEFHLMVHAGDKKLQCRFCGKLFHIQRDLLRHERTHTGEKPHACHLCPKTFNIKPHLTMHIRTHTGERPYKCSICDKCFSQSNSLRIHKKIHLKVTNTDPEAKKTSRRRSRKSKSSAALAVIGPIKPEEILGIPCETRGTELENANAMGKIEECVDSSNLIEAPNLIIITENISIPSQTLDKPDSSSQPQTSDNYIQVSAGAALQPQYYDPVQQAWRMAISQTQPSLNTSVIVDSRVSQPSGQVFQIRSIPSSRNVLPLPNPGPSGQPETGTTYSVPQFYDSNIRYFDT